MDLQLIPVDGDGQRVDLNPSAIKEMLKFEGIGNAQHPPAFNLKSKLVEFDHIEINIEERSIRIGKTKKTNS